MFDCVASDIDTVYGTLYQVFSRKTSADLHTDHKTTARKKNLTVMLDNVRAGARVKHIAVCDLSFVLLSSWSRDECHASLRPRLADPPLPCFAARDSARRVKLVPHPRVGDDGGENSGTWAVSNRTPPNRVAPLPARRARQMFFVADYDAVCAIMTTSLFLSPAPSLSFHLMLFPLTPRTTALGGWIFFSFSLCLSFSVSYLYLFPAEDKLCSCLSRSLSRRLGHAKRRLSFFSFSL